MICHLIHGDEGELVFFYSEIAKVLKSHFSIFYLPSKDKLQAQGYGPKTEPAMLT